MKQLTFATGGVERCAKTQRAAFLAEMAFYPKPGNGGRSGVERMLRVHSLQQWLNLSDPAVGEALYDFGGDAPVCRDRPRPRTGVGRDDRVPLPAAGRGARSGPATV